MVGTEFKKSAGLICPLIIDCSILRQSFFLFQHPKSEFHFVGVISFHDHRFGSFTLRWLGLGFEAKTGTCHVFETNKTNIFTLGLALTVFSNFFRQNRHFLL